MRNPKQLFNLYFWAFLIGLFSSAVSALATDVTITDARTGQPIQINSVLYNPADDSGPIFQVNVQNASAYVNVYVMFQYIDQANNGFIYSSDPIMLGNGNWYLPFPGLGGQSVTISWSDICGEGVGTVNFKDYGTNPLVTLIQSVSYKYGTPWFWPLILSDESSGMQYATSTYSSEQIGGAYVNRNRNVIGFPYWGGPDGIGVTQIDGTVYALTYQDYFNVTQNVTDGIGVLFSKEAGSDQWVTSQFAQAWVESGPFFPSIPVYGNCGVFGTGDDERNLYDGNWMTRYNGGNLFYYQNATPDSPGEWVVNHAAYITRVCNKPYLF